MFGAHNSNVSFRNPLIKQWYTNDSVFVQFCISAILLQFFLFAAFPQSSLDVGQISTRVTLSTASWQYFSTLLHNYSSKSKMRLWSYFSTCTDRQNQMSLYINQNNVFTCIGSKSRITYSRRVKTIMTC